jgi:hypothetical protein
MNCAADCRCRSCHMRRVRGSMSPEAEAKRRAGIEAAKVNRHALASAQDAVIRQWAGRVLAERIGEMVGMTAAQVHGRARLLRISMALGPEAAAELNQRRSEGVERAWTNPATRDEMLDGMRRRHSGG